MPNILTHFYRNEETQSVMDIWVSQRVQDLIINNSLYRNEFQLINKKTTEFENMASPVISYVRL